MNLTMQSAKALSGDEDFAQNFEASQIVVLQYITVTGISRIR
jgi:hypothetical protein